MSDQATDQNPQDQPGGGGGPDKNEKDQAGKDQNQEKTVPYARFQQVNEAKKQAETELKAVADGLKEEVPEEFRDLIPDLPPGQLIKWLRQAQAKGIFNPPKADALDTKRPGDKKTPDLNSMTPHEMRKAGYKS
jgi:hypothetical protein